MHGRQKTCLNRFLGRCKGCSRDYNQKHHPNNLDCPNYKELHILVIDVKDVKDVKDVNKRKQ